MIDLLCKDILRLICEYLKPSQLLWLMRFRKRLRDVIAPIVKERYNELVLVMNGDMGSYTILPIFRCDLKGKKLYYVDYRSRYDLEFVEQLGLIVPLIPIGLYYSPKNPYEFEKMTKVSRDNHLVVVIYRVMDDAMEIATLYDIDYICYGVPMPLCHLYQLHDNANVVWNLVEDVNQKYDYKKRLVYGVKSKMFYYLDFQ